ncbi:ATP-binding protein [Lewinella sp. IMCC34191]|uniref:ATP-binding protein n=1 Tax=Lewinella sp. IMCC34191 TaxID=2259172 RepID=UPI000E233D0F|nr:ATP-binding protein [Lewinella sp. IMCC34191]
MQRSPISFPGPRQSAKTTLLKQLFPDYRYLSFLQRNDRQVILDEAQRVPDLFSYLQTRVDEDREPGRYVLSGSQNFLLSERISQSLAGRVGVARLLPLDFAELSAADLLPPTPPDAIVRGFYPELYQTDLPSSFFYPSYVSTYLERDVTPLVRSANMGDFRRLMALCAASVSQTLNYSTFAKRLQLSVPTVKTWLHYLEQSYVIFTVGPYFENFGKRLVKSPKLYFTDTGLAAYLLQLGDGAQVQASEGYGALFENLIVANLRKSRFHAGNQHPLYYYRDNHQLEVDLLEPTGSELILTEIKATTTYRDRLRTNLDKVAKLVGKPVRKRVIYGGDSQIIGDVEYLSWREGV